MSKEEQDEIDKILEEEFSKADDDDLME